MESKKEKNILDERELCAMSGNGNELGIFQEQKEASVDKIEWAWDKYWARREKESEREMGSHLIRILHLF